MSSRNIRIYPPVIVAVLVALVFMAAAVVSITAEAETQAAQETQLTPEQEIISQFGGQKITA